MKIRPAPGWLIALLAAAWFGTLAARPLYKPDEARYGEIAREMVQRGDWITPRLNGFKYFEKPPLQYWASAAAFKVFGESDWSARLWTGLMALLGVALTFHAARRLAGPGAGWLAAAVLAGLPLYVLLGQISTLDMGVSVMLSGAVFFFALAQREASEKQRRSRTLLAWGACALAVLSKGLIGVLLPAATVGLYIVLRRDWGLLRRLELRWGVAILLALVAPWFVAVSVRNPEFAHFFFVQEHWQRFTTTMHHRVHPWWYFLPVLGAGIAPWLFPVLAGWARALRRPRERSFSVELFLGLWALVVLVFFSLSGSKLPPYILPMLPALAVLAGAYLAEHGGSGLLTAQCLLLAGLGVALSSGTYPEAYGPWASAAAVALLAAGAAGAAAASAEMRSAAVACISAGALAATLLVVVGHRVLAPSYSIGPLVAAVPGGLPEHARAYSVETYDHSMPWTLRRTVTMVGYKDELAVPIGWEGEHFVPDLASFRRAWSAPGEAYAFFALRDYERLRAELGLPMEELARSPRYVLVRKP